MMNASATVKATTPGTQLTTTAEQLRRRISAIILQFLLVRSVVENRRQRSVTTRSSIGAGTTQLPSSSTPTSHRDGCARRRVCAALLPPPLRFCALIWTLLCLMSIIDWSGNQRLAAASAFTLHYVRQVSPSQPPLENDIDGPLELYPRIRRNVLIFSKLHRSVWPSPVDGHEEWPKRFVTMDEDWNFDY